MACCGNKVLTPTPYQAMRGVVGLAKVATGIGLAPDDIIQHRRDRCRECEFATRNKELMARPSKGLTAYSQCEKCTCFIKYKTQVASEQCPLEKW